jgi:N-succinyldiaminopimelate aminotransferase
MSLPVQRASIAAWGDEAHVRENRRLYAEKFDAVLPLLKGSFKTAKPAGGFYLWLPTPIDDAQFVRRLQHEYNVLALPGSYLAREVDGANPGKNRVRVALVAPLEECVEGIERMMQFAAKL